MMRKPRRALLRFAGGVLATALMLAVPVAPPPSGHGARHARMPVVFDRLTSAGDRLSRAISAPWDFSLVGVSWRRAELSRGEASIRTSVDGVHWSPWNIVETADNGPDRGTDEDRGIVATEPLWVGRARFAEIRWPAEVGKPPSSLSMHVIDPGADPRAPASSAAAAPAQPGIISRSQWGADESLRRCCPTFAQSVDFAVVHHTVTNNTYSSAESSRIVRSIYEYHVRANGWADIGYHFLIDRFGRVFEGRYGGITAGVIGAHAEGFNTGSTGVALIGSFQSQAPSGSAMSALRNLLAWKLDNHHVDPRSSMTVVSGGSRKYAAGRSVRVNAIASHRDLQETTCPGDTVISSLPKLRNDVYGFGLPKIFRPTLTPSVFSPNGDGSNDTLRTTAALSGGSSWRVRVRNDAGTTLRSWTGTGNADIRWDGRDAVGNAAPHGYYKLDISATAGSASATPAAMTGALYRDPWGAWTRAGSPIEAAGSPRLTRAPDGAFHLLARDTVGALRHWRWSGSVWGSSRRLGSSGEVASTQGRFGFVSGSDGVLHAVIRGRNSNLHHGRILRDGTFTGWAQIGGSGDRGTDVALARDGKGTIHALIVGMNGNLYTNRYTGRWSGWKRVGASNDKGRHPVLATGRGGDVLAVVVSDSTGIYANQFDPTKGWRSRWSGVGRSLGYGTEPSIAAVAEGFVVVVRGASAPNIWQSGGSIGQWSSWSRVGSASDAGYEPAALGVRGDVVLVVRGKSSGRIYANVRAPSGSWRGWDEAGDSVQTGVLPTLASGRGQVMVAAEVPGEQPATAIGRPPLRPN